MFKKNIVHIPILLLIIVVLFTGILGVDFGSHWDESGIINSVTRSIESGILLPRSYHYPSLCYNLVFFSLLLDTAHIFLDTNVIKNKLSGISIMSQIVTVQQKLINISKGHSFKLRNRIIFILISYLSLLWIYFLILSWRKSWIEAMLASSFLGLSWEVAYHARWIAPDVIMMQFAVFTMMCLFLAQNNINKRLWLTLSIIGAGLASATKYPGGLLLLPVIFAIYYNNPTEKSQLLHRVSKAILIFVLINLIITPGIIIDPIRFFRDVLSEVLHYAIVGHGGHTVTPGIRHFLLIFNYFCMAVFSKYRVISSVFFAMALIGIFSLVKEEKKTAIVVLCFPFLYILLMSCQKVMIVRNLMVLVPFFAIFASRGCIFLCSKFKHRSYRLLFCIYIAVSLLINALWLVKAANSITRKNRVNYIAQLAHYIDRRPDTLFLLTKSLANDLAHFDNMARTNVVQNFSYNVKAAVFYSSQISRQATFRTANKLNCIWFGPYEVNFNYYPSWLGDERIVVMPIKSALDLGIFYHIGN